MTSFKKSFVKPFAHPNETYTVEDSYWKKLTVSIKCRYINFHYAHFIYVLEPCIS